MMRKFTLLIICTMIAVGVSAQQPTAQINKIDISSDLPVLDGQVDEVWAEAEPENIIDKTLLDQVPTLGNSGETTWQGLWSFEGIWILIRVTDDDFYPHYEAGVTHEWQNDKPEIYFDVNFELADGGAPVSGNGHYQITPGFSDGLNNGTELETAEGVKYAFLVNEPNYVAEYFIPFNILKNETGGTMDMTEPIGFDIYVIDRDEGDAGERIAVWANEGAQGSSWNNMDDCGVINFDQAEPPVWIDGISIEGGEAITENNGTLQFTATLDPENANEGFKWTLENNGEDGRAKIATISKDGVLTANMNGTVTVTAISSTGFAEASAEVTISGQVISMGDINLIRNGFFRDVDKDGVPLEWTGGDGEQGPPYVNDDGYVVLDPDGAGEFVWDFRYSQSEFGCNNEDPYTLRLKAYADAERTFNLDFESFVDGVYPRYGTSNHPAAELAEGTSDWTFDLTTEPTTYVFDVVFGGLTEDMTENFNFFMGTSDEAVYIDSVILMNDLDMALVDEYTPVNEIIVTGDDGATTVGLGGTLAMIAEVFPAEAEYTDVKWSVVPGSGYATIDESGVLTGDSSGTVTVVASAVDDSYVTGERVIHVAFPEGISQHSVNSLKVYPNPAVNELIVILTRENSIVSIYNSVGMKLDEVTVVGTEYKFDISTYPSGFYFVKTENALSKFIK